MADPDSIDSSFASYDWSAGGRVREGDYDFRDPTFTISNLSSQHSLYNTRIVEGLGGVFTSGYSELLPTTYEGSNTFATSTAPANPSWYSMTNGESPEMVFQNGDTIELTDPLSYSQIIGTSGNTFTYVGVTMSVDPTTLVPTYEVGTIAPEESASGSYIIRMDRPVVGGSWYGFANLEVVVAQTCLPDPTIDSWVSEDGMTGLTGTGDYEGDTIEIRTAAGDLIGTTTVNADLAWSFQQTEAFPVGVTELIVTETDEFELTGEGDGSVRVTEPDNPEQPTTKEPTTATNTSNRQKKNVSVKLPNTGS